MTLCEIIWAREKELEARISTRSSKRHPAAMG
jgi:hypothetical protein